MKSPTPKSALNLSVLGGAHNVLDDSLLNAMLASRTRGSARCIALVSMLCGTVHQFSETASLVVARADTFVEALATDPPGVGEGRRNAALPTRG